MRYRATTPTDAPLRNRLKALAHERRRFGYRRLHVLLCVVDACTRECLARIAWRDIPVGRARGEFAIWGKNLLQDNSYTYGFDGAGFAEYLTPPLTAGVEFRITY